MTGYWMAAVVSLWILLCAVAVAQVGLLRRVAPLLADSGPGHVPHGPGGIEVGATPADFRAETATGEPANRGSLLGRPTLVLLTSAGCQPCDELVAELRAEPVPLKLVVVIDEHDDVAELRLPQHITVLRQFHHSAAEAFGTTGTPFAFALDAAGVVRARGIPARVADLTALATALRSVRV